MSKFAEKRLRKELLNIHKEPPPYIEVAVNDRNLLEWDYLLEGPPDTPYERGWYHGRIRFPPQYPMAPPEIVMYTPNGRFNTNTPLCLSMSNFHPESWNPAWSVATILKGLLSFMCEDQHTMGAIAPPPSLEERRKLAEKSMDSNLQNPTFVKFFPEIVQRVKSEGLSSLSLAPDSSRDWREAELEESTETAKEPPPQPADPPPSPPAPTAPALEAPKPAATTPPHEAPQRDVVPTPPKAGTGALDVGATVILRGFAARKDLNGMKGLVQSVAGGRYSVVVENGEIISVRRNVLELADA